MALSLVYLRLRKNIGSVAIYFGPKWIGHLGERILRCPLVIWDLIVHGLAVLLLNLIDMVKVLGTICLPQVLHLHGHIVL